jgi:hypothetical protein
METLDDSRVIGDQCDERRAISVVVQPHVDRCLDWSTERYVVDLGSEPSDDAVCDQPLQASTCGIGTKPDSPAEFSVSYSGIDLY